MANNIRNFSTSGLPATMTLAEIRPIVQYGTTITTYQMLRKYRVDPVSTRPQGGKGGHVNVYNTQDVISAFKDRLSRLYQDGT